jgi:cobalt-zinc-cadmium efflux system protein
VSADHIHSGGLRAGYRHRGRLAVVVVLVAVVMVVEVVAGFITGSLALISDAGHMATDALGVGMALAAIVAANKARTGDHRTFGLYRLEILAALANAVLLFLVAGYVVYEGLSRLRNPPSIDVVPMLVVGVIGLSANLISWRLLRQGATESLNVEGAMAEVIADLVGSIGVVVAALITQVTGWLHADPLFAVAIGIFIAPRAWRLGRRAVRVLVQAAPEGLDVGKVKAGLASIRGVSDVHDLHIWTLTSEMPVASVHLMTPAGVDPHPILDQARNLLHDLYGIAHATLQVEPDTHEGCAEVTW